MSIDIETYDTLQQLFESTAYRLRAGSFSGVENPVTSKEIEAAKIFWLQKTQQTYFPNVNL